MRGKVSFQIWDILGEDHGHGCLRSPTMAGCIHGPRGTMMSTQTRPRLCTFAFVCLAVCLGARWSGCPVCKHGLFANRLFACLFASAVGKHHPLLGKTSGTRYVRC